jgi:hypothetical protein
MYSHYKQREMHGDRFHQIRLRSKERDKTLPNVETNDPYPGMPAGQKSQNQSGNRNDTPVQRQAVVPRFVFPE